MKVIYDPEVDVLRIVFSDLKIEESDEGKPGVILDYAEDGKICFDGDFGCIQDDSSVRFSV
jgi:uncharacterized protein YuzE